LHSKGKEEVLRSSNPYGVRSGARNGRPLLCRGQEKKAIPKKENGTMQTTRENH